MRTHHLILVPLLVGVAAVTLLGRSAPVALDVPARADATPSIAASGSFVAVAWGASADGKADVYVATSRDGGLTFGAPVQVNRVSGEARLGGELPPRVALHAGAASAQPDVSVLWTARGTGTAIKIAQSRDGGRSFAEPVSLQAPGAAGDRGWPALAVDAAGRAHAIWLDHRGLAADRVTSASDGAAVHQHHARVASGDDGVAQAQRSAIYHATLGANVPGERAIASGVCYCCKTALAAGPAGTLVAAWRHVYPGDLRDIAMAVSRDGGQTFSSPARVSEDGWAINGCPDDGPAVVVDTGGTAHVVWPTVIPGETPEGALFYASTVDGRTFTPRVRIPTLGSPKPMHPQITRDADGKLVVAWDELIGGAHVAAARWLRVSAAGVPTFGAPVRLAASGASSHPVLAGSSTGVVAAWSTGGESSRVMVRVVPMN